MGWLDMNMSTNCLKCVTAVTWSVKSCFQCHIDTITLTYPSSIGRQNINIRLPMQCRCDAAEVWLTKICLHSHSLIGQMISDEFKHSKLLWVIFWPTRRPIHMLYWLGKEIYRMVKACLKYHRAPAHLGKSEASAGPTVCQGPQHTAAG